MTTILQKLNYCLKWFEPQYVDKRMHWQLFDYYVLACGDLKKYKTIGSHSGQLDFLINSDPLIYPNRKENGLHAGNGWGKTDVIARKHLKNILLHLFRVGGDGKYLNRFDDKYRTLNVSITLEQAEMVMDRIIDIVSQSPMLDWLIKDVVRKPMPEIRWISGARTQFKTTKRKAESVEGKEYGYISADDIALEQYLEFIREFVLFPRIRKYRDSQLDFFATPKLQNGYYRILEDIKKKGGYVRAGSSYENPHIDHNTLDYMKKNWSKEKVAMILFGQFVDTAEMMFASRIENVIDSSLDFEDVQPNQKYIEGWDLARGRKGPDKADQTVGYRIKEGKVNQVVQRWAFQLPWTEKERKNINKELGKIVETSSTEREIRKAHAESKARVFLDSTGVGDTLYGIVQDIAKPVDFRGQKDKLLDHAQAVMDAGMIKIPFIPNLVEQMSTYQRDDKDLDTDDLMALVVSLSCLKVVDNFIGTLDT